VSKKILFITMFILILISGCSKHIQKEYHNEKPKFLETIFSFKNSKGHKLSIVRGYQYLEQFMKKAEGRKMTEAQLDVLL
jgi:hypothetical protein